jgi:arsenate reductase
MHVKPTNVLFVSKNNAARSLLAEACLRQIGGSKFRSFSCGVPGYIWSKPADWTLLTLGTLDIGAQGLACKDWSGFLKSGAAKMDFVIALDAESVHQHPSWPGQPQTALWEYPPILLEKKGLSDLGIPMLTAMHSLRKRLEILVSLHSKISKRSELLHDLRDLAHL